MKFPKLVIEEATNLKKYATKEEIEKLDFEILNPESKFTCIYGQMTGSCFSQRAGLLIEKSCSRVYSKFDTDSKTNQYVDSNTKLNGKPKAVGYERIGVWYSPIEVFISKAYRIGDMESPEKLIKFIKGEIETL